MASLGEGQRPSVPQSDVFQRLMSMKLTRRTLLRGVAVTGTGLATAAVVGCGSSSDKTEPGSVQNNNGSQDKTVKTEAPPEAGWKRYHADTFTIDYPEDWSATIGNGGQNARIQSGQEDFNPYLYFETGELQPNETTVDDFKKRAIRNLQYDRGDEIVGGRDNITEDTGDSRKIAGHDTLAMDYQRQWNDGVHNHVTYLFLTGVDGRTTWKFDLSAPDLNPKFTDIMDKVINTFVLKNTS